MKGFYSGGAILLGYEDEIPFGCIAIKKIDDNICEAKRLYIKRKFRGKGYARMFPPVLSMFVLNSPSAAYILPRPARISLVHS